MKFFLILFAIGFSAFQSLAQVDTEAFHQALKLKKNLYYQDGTVTGGDRNSSDFRVSQIRIAPNPAGYDRMVIDLAGNVSGDKSALARPPYYQVELDSVLKLVHVTLYGKPKLEFSTQATAKAVKKTHHLTSVELLPLVEQDRWTFTLHTRPKVKIEVFELTEPARIIVDFK